MTRDKGTLPPARITPRQQEVLTLLAAGLRLREIAARLHVRVTTVEAHIARLRQRAGVETQTGLVRWACREGVVAVPKEGPV